MNKAEIEILRDLADYTRTLEEELDGSDSGEGAALVAANGLLADVDPEIDHSRLIEIEGGLLKCLGCGAIGKAGPASVGHPDRD